MFKGAWLASFNILAFLTFTEICAVNTLLVAFTILLLTETLPAVASFEMSLLLITYSKQSEIRGLGGGTEEDLALLLDVDLVNLYVFFE
jgi:hypothetical protein